MAAGWLASDTPPALSIVDPQPSDDVMVWAADGRAIINPAPVPADTLVVAVKPQVFASVADAVAGHAGPDTLVLSVMAGVRLARLSSALGATRIVRAMPNTPGAIGRGVSLICPGTGASQTDVETVKSLLSPLGTVEGPMDEDTLVKATAVSGCGPAYVFLLAELMANAGAARGLDPRLSARIAKATVEGAAALMAQSDQTPTALRDAVTSPGGVTKAALDVLMRPDATPSLFEEAFAAAEARDNALSDD